MSTEIISNASVCGKTVQGLACTYNLDTHRHTHRLLAYKQFFPNLILLVYHHKLYVGMQAKHARHKDCQ